MLVLKRTLIAVSLVSFMFVGCTRYANENELQDLENTKLAARKAEQRLSDLKRERAQLEDKLAEKKEELKAVQNEKAAVESRLK